MENSDKIILDLCGGTGSWSAPYKQAGYQVHNITLPVWDVRTYRPLENVYGILAAPVCTMFSLARTRAKTPRDFKEGMELVMACLKIIWKCRYKPLYKNEGALVFWALENPMGFLRQFLGIPPLTFNPCDYGDPYTKKTDIWGFFNIPVKKSIAMTEEQKYRNSQNTRKFSSISEITSSTQASKRAITPQGFTKAFFKANP